MEKTDFWNIENLKLEMYEITYFEITKFLFRKFKLFRNYEFFFRNFKYSKFLSSESRKIRTNMVWVSVFQNFCFEYSKARNLKNITFEILKVRKLKIPKLEETVI